MTDAPQEQFRPQETPRAPQQLAWQPSATDYQSFGTSALDQQAQANNALIGSGVLTDLQFDFGNMPVLAQVEATNKQGYIPKTPDLDAIDPSQLSPDAQFGGPVGNWFRYLGREIMHTAQGMSQPGAVDNMIFGSAVRAKHYFDENDRAHMTEDAQKALKHFAEMTPSERSKASAQLALAFFFVGGKTPLAAETAEQMGLKNMSQEQLAALGIEHNVPMMFNGERLSLDGIEVTQATGDKLNSIWLKGWSLRGFEGEQHMGVTGILAKNFPRIDDAMFQDGVFTSMKTLDLNAQTYQNMEKLEKRLESCLDKLDTWKGQEKFWGGQRIDASEIQEKVLQIGIPNGCMTPEQAAVFEKIGREATARGIRLKVTAIE